MLISGEWFGSEVVSGLEEPVGEVVLGGEEPGMLISGGWFGSEVASG